jgi:hypothetical protein
MQLLQLRLGVEVLSMEGYGFDKFCGGRSVVRLR